jgi:hypothetical protein
MSTTRKDVKQAWRSFRDNPLFTATPWSAADGPASGSLLTATPEAQIFAPWSTVIASYDVGPGGRVLALLPAEPAAAAGKLVLITNFRQRLQ